MATKKRAARNRTIDLSPTETDRLRGQLAFEPAEGFIDKVICGDAFELLTKIPERSFDLLLADPPYNLSKTFGSETFSAMGPSDYEDWLDSWLTLCVTLLKETASVYICGDWRSSSAI